MPDFGNSFSGLAHERKLTHEELIRAIRFMVAAEYEVQNMTFSRNHEQGGRQETLSRQ